MPRRRRGSSSSSRSSRSRSRRRKRSRRSPELRKPSRRDASSSSDSSSGSPKVKLRLRKAASEKALEMLQAADEKAAAPPAAPVAPSPPSTPAAGPPPSPPAAPTSGPDASPEDATPRSDAATPRTNGKLKRPSSLADLGDLSALQKQLEEERKKLQLFVLKAKQEQDDKDKKKADAVSTPPETRAKREQEYFKASFGDTCGPGGRFVVEEELGRGVFSSVYRCKDAESGSDYAIKFTRKNTMMRKAAEKEVKLMGRISKEAAQLDPEGASSLLSLSFFEGIEHEGHLALVFEVMKCDMRAGIQKYGMGKGLPLLPTVRNFGRNIFTALRVLRRLQVIHCDVKPENLLLSLDKESVKLSDFGAAMPLAERVRTDYMQPRYYRAPEVILGHSYSTQIDMWSAGTTLFELATGVHLFEGGTNNEMLHLMLQARGKFPIEFATSGEFSKKHFNASGDFLNANGDFALNSTNPAVIPMASFEKPTRPVANLLEQALTEPPRGVDPARHKGMVANLANLIESCLKPDHAVRITPDEALRHRFFARGA